MNEPTEAFVKELLENPFAHGRVWSIQGLGMLRTYLDDDEIQRLHIWDLGMSQTWNKNGFDVSTIHDHPWDFESLIYSGGIRNRRWAPANIADVRSGRAERFHGAHIRCGVGGGLTSDRDGLDSDGMAWLTPSTENIRPGERYSQEASELHESYPTDGAVTVITRDFKADRDHARVFWRQGDWVSAEPRPATSEEVRHFVDLAKRNWLTG